jgi:hypothetical protein
MASRVLTVEVDTRPITEEVHLLQAQIERAQAAATFNTADDAQRNLVKAWRGRYLTVFVDEDGDGLRLGVSMRRGARVRR